MNLTGEKLVIQGNVYALHLVGKFTPPMASDLPLIETIKTRVCSHFDLTAAELTGRTRTDRICRARFFAYSLARECGMTLNEIGHAFKKDHGAVISGINRLNNWRSTEKPIEAQYVALRKQLGIKPPTPPTEQTKEG